MSLHFYALSQPKQMSVNLNVCGNEMQLLEDKENDNLQNIFQSMTLLSTLHAVLFL